MRDIMIISGIAKNVAVPFRRYTITFDLEQPKMSTAVVLRGFAAPFDSGEFIAVAVKKSVMQSYYVALAYRDLGQRAATVITSPLLEIAGIVFGMLGLCLAVFTSVVVESGEETNSGIWVICALLIFLGGYCGLRLRYILAARKALRSWTPPP